MRADDRTDHVMRVLDVRHPVAQSFVDRVLERRRTGFDGDDLGPQHLHPHDVQVLAPDVGCAHEDDARQPEVRRRRRGRDAVLPGPGLGDDPLSSPSASRAGPGPACC